MNLRPTFEHYFPEGSHGGQCGVFSHSLVTIPPLGNSIIEKRAAVAKYGIAGSVNIRAGDVIIFDIKTPYGHVAVVNQDPTDVICLTESNWHLDEIVHHTRTVPAHATSIVGVIRGPLKVAIINPPPMIDYKVLIVSNNHTSPNIAAQLQEIHDTALNWSGGKLNVIPTLLNTSLTPVYSDRGTFPDPNQGGVIIHEYCVDQSWYDQNITPLAKGYDCVVLWIDTNDWQGNVQGNIQGLMTAGNPIMIQNKAENASIEMNFKNGSGIWLVSKLTLHELAHGFYETAKQQDKTHYYDYSDPLGLAGAYQNIVWDWVAQQLLIRRASAPQGEDMIIVNQVGSGTLYLQAGEELFGFVDFPTYQKATAGKTVKKVELSAAQFAQFPINPVVLKQ